MYLAMVSCCQQARGQYKPTSIIVPLDSVLLLLGVFEYAYHLANCLLCYDLK